MEHDNLVDLHKKKLVPLKRCKVNILYNTTQQLNRPIKSKGFQAI